MSVSHDSSDADPQELQLYLRRVGRITGPYQLKMLRKMLHRSQLSRFHELSWDGCRWAPAGEFDDLFGSQSGAQDTGEMVEEIVPIEEIAMPVEDPHPEVSQQWYYENDDQPMGPISFESLLDLIATGGVLVTTRIWTDGMTDWSPAEAVAALQPATLAKSTALQPPTPADLQRGDQWA